MTDNNTISSVVKDELCTGCGTCVALCPVNAIMIINEKKGIYIPELDDEKCNNCGICLKVCPGHEVNFKELNREIFGKEPEDILIGGRLSKAHSAKSPPIGRAVAFARRTFSHRHHLFNLQTQIIHRCLP